MSRPIATLAVDFGEVGFINDKQKFNVTLESSPLSKLISDAKNAYRIYELFLISRPGDIWSYVNVVPESVPKWFSERLKFAKKKVNQQQPDSYVSRDSVIPFIEFDDLFFWDEDDYFQGNNAWMERRDSDEFRVFAKQLFNQVLDTQISIELEDELFKHVINLIKNGIHPFDYLDRDSAVLKSNGCSKLSDHQPAYYRILEQLLRDENIISVACRGGDYQTLRIMAVEQRRRANLSGQKPNDALELSVLVNIHVDNAWWDSRILFYQEGLAYGDLLINGIDDVGESIKKLVEQYKRIHSRYILCSEDQGDISGYDKLVGIAWVLYSKQVS